MRAAILGLCLVAVTLLGTGVARADLKVGTYAPDIEAKSWANWEAESVSLQELRGMVVMIFFWSTWDQVGEQLMPLMTLLSSKQFGQGNGVFIMGLTDAEQSRVEGMLKKQKVFFPVGFEARKTFDEFDIKQPPRILIIDTHGKIAWSGWAIEKSGQGLVDELTKITVATPPTKTHPFLVAKVEAYLKEARQALRSDNYREAYEASEKASDMALRGDQLKTHCQDYLDLIQALGRDKLAQADAAADEKKYKDAIGLLLEVRREFKGMELAITARKRLDALRKKNKDAADIMTQMEAGGQAEAILATAMEELRAASDKNSPESETIRRKLGGAYVQLEEIVDKYGTTGTAKKARTIIDRVKKNEAMFAYVKDFKAEKPCRTLISQADSYLQTGKTAKAKELYHEVITKYGDTIWSQEAAQKLSQMP